MIILRVLGALVFAFAMIGPVMVLIKAWVAKRATGKWPHQSKESKNVFDSLS